MTFELKANLPQETQKEIDRISAIASGLRSASEAAFLTALAPYVTNEVLEYDSAGLIAKAAGNTLPTSYAGFKKGAQFIKKNATGNGLYGNTGDETSATWNLIDQADTADIPDKAVTLAKLADMATASMLGRATAGSGVPEVLSAVQIRTLINVADGANNYVHPNHTGNVTSTGDGATVLASLPTGTPVNAVAASKVLTLSGLALEGEIVTIGAVAYKFTATVTLANDVLIGVSAEACIDNLVLAITHGAGEGTNYGTGTVANPLATAVKASPSTMTVTNLIKGIVGNSTPIAETLTNGSFAGGATFLSGGVDGTVGIQWQPMVDASYLYICIAANTIADANWRRIALGSAF